MTRLAAVLSAVGQLATIDVVGNWHSPRTGKFIQKPWVSIADILPAFNNDIPHEIAELKVAAEIARMAVLRGREDIIISGAERLETMLDAAGPVIHARGDEKAVQAFDQMETAAAYLAAPELWAQDAGFGEGFGDGFEEDVPEVSPPDTSIRDVFLATLQLARAVTGKRMANATSALRRAKESGDISDADAILNGAIAEIRFNLSRAREDGTITQPDYEDLLQTISVTEDALEMLTQEDLEHLSEPKAATFVGQGELRRLQREAKHAATDPLLAVVLLEEAQALLSTLPADKRPDLEALMSQLRRYIGVTTNDPEGNWAIKSAEAGTALDEPAGLGSFTTIGKFAPPGMDRETAVMIAAVPRNDTDLPGPEDPKHATLLYFGDIGEHIDPSAKSLLANVVSIAASETDPFYATVKGVEELGDKGAQVWMLDSPTLQALREELLEIDSEVNSVLEDAHERGVTAYPDFKPHVTIGYPTADAGTSLVSEDLEEAEGVSEIAFDRIGLWWGDEYLEFPLEQSIEPSLSSARAELAVVDKMGNWHHPRTGKFLEKPWKFDLSLKLLFSQEQQDIVQEILGLEKHAFREDVYRLRKHLRQLEKDPENEKLIDAIWGKVADLRERWSLAEIKTRNKSTEEPSGELPDFEAVDSLLDQLEEGLEYLETAVTAANLGVPLDGSQFAAAYDVIHLSRGKRAPKPNSTRSARVTPIVAAGGIMPRSTTKPQPARPAPSKQRRTAVKDKWEGPLGFEGKFTGDNRYIVPQALDFENVSFPQPFRWASEDIGAHDGARVIGTIAETFRFSAPTIIGGVLYPVGTIWGRGTFDMDSDIGREAQRHVEKKLTNGVSLDLDKISAEVSDPAQLAADGIELDLSDAVADMNITAIRGARSRSATLVALPAFEGARLAAVAEWTPLGKDSDEVASESEAPTLVAAGVNPALTPGSSNGKSSLNFMEKRHLSLITKQTFAGIDKGGNWHATVPGKGNRWVPMPDRALEALIKLVNDAPDMPDAVSKEEALGDLPEILDDVKAKLESGDIAGAQDRVGEVLDSFPFEDYQDLGVPGFEDEEGTETDANGDTLHDALNAFVSTDPDAFAELTAEGGGESGGKSPHEQGIEAAKANAPAVGDKVDTPDGPGTVTGYDEEGLAGDGSVYTQVELDTPAPLGDSGKTVSKAKYPASKLKPASGEGGGKGPATPNPDRKAITEKYGDVASAMQQAGKPGPGQEEARKDLEAAGYDLEAYGTPAVEAPADEGTKSGRGPSGKPRNFGAMNDEKFEAEAAKVEAENNDPEVLEVIAAEREKRGLGAKADATGGPGSHKPLRPGDVITNEDGTKVERQEDGSWKPVDDGGADSAEPFEGGGPQGNQTAQTRGKVARRDAPHGGPEGGGYIEDLTAANEYLAADDMTQYLEGSLAEAVTSIKWSIPEDDPGSWQVDIETSRPLNEDEAADLKSFIEGQNSDGLGEGFEQQEFAQSTEDAGIWVDGEGPFGGEIEANAYAEQRYEELGIADEEDGEDYETWLDSVWEESEPVMQSLRGEVDVSSLVGKTDIEVEGEIAPAEGGAAPEAAPSTPSSADPNSPEAALDEMEAAVEAENAEIEAAAGDEVTDVKTGETKPLEDMSDKDLESLYRMYHDYGGASRNQVLADIAVEQMGKIAQEQERRAKEKATGGLPPAPTREELMEMDFEELEKYKKEAGDAWSKQSDVKRNIKDIGSAKDREAQVLSTELFVRMQRAIGVWHIRNDMREHEAMAEKAKRLQKPDGSLSKVTQGHVARAKAFLEKHAPESQALKDINEMLAGRIPGAEADADTGGKKLSSENPDRAAIVEKYGDVASAMQQAGKAGPNQAEARKDLEAAGYDLSRSHGPAPTGKDEAEEVNTTEAKSGAPKGDPTAQKKLVTKILGPDVDPSIYEGLVEWAQAEGKSDAELTDAAQTASKQGWPSSPAEPYIRKLQPAASPPRVLGEPAEDAFPQVSGVSPSELGEMYLEAQKAGNKDLMKAIVKEAQKQGTDIYEILDALNELAGWNSGVSTLAFTGFMSDIYNEFVTAGFSESQAKPLTLSTVRRWAAGGSTVPGDKAKVSKNTQRKAATALVEFRNQVEVERERAKLAAEVGTFNWVDDVGGLPLKIREIADAVMKKGKEEGHAIAIAVNAVKKGCATGDLNFPGKQSMNPASRAEYCEALAEWEAKKALAKATSLNLPVHTAKLVSAQKQAFKDAEIDGVDSETFEKIARDALTVAKKLKAKPTDKEVEGAVDNLLDSIDQAFDYDRDEVGSLVASGAMTTKGSRAKRKLAAPIKPPAAWFEDPKFKMGTPLTVTKEGRVFGHLALWGSCHSAFGNGAGGECVVVPMSKTDYSLFHLGVVETAEGTEVPVGRLAMNTGHANDQFGSRRAIAHYENTGLAIADIHAGEDQFGIWISGALRPDATDVQIRALKASPLSGDWRYHAGTNDLELVMALAVNMPGFAVPRPQFLVASGAVRTLVAAGMVPPTKVSRQKVEAAMAGDQLAIDDIKYLQRLAARERAHEAKVLRHRMLAASGADEKVHAMAMRLEKMKASAEPERKPEPEPEPKPKFRYKTTPRPGDAKKGK